MAFPATNVLPARAWEQVKNEAGNVRALCVSKASEYAAGDPVSRTDVLNLRLSLKRAIARFNELKNVPGLVAYAIAQEENAGLDLPAEFTAMIGAMQAVMDKIEVDFPTQGGAALDDDIEGNPLTFASSSLTGP